MIEAEPELSTPERSGLPPVTLGVMLVAAFGLGFLVMFGWQKTHQPKPNVVAGTAMQPGPKVHLDPPDVSVSASAVAPPLTDEERETIANAINALSDPDRADAISDLVSLGEKSIPAATEAMKSENGNVRANASTVINEIAGGTDEEPNTPADVARLRPLFDKAGTVRVLINIAKDPNELVKQNVAYAIGNIGDKAGYDTLVALSSDSAPDVRAGVARSLGKLDNYDGLPTLTTLLADPDPSVRAVAADALGSFDSPVAKSALKDRLEIETDDDVIEHLKAQIEGRSVEG